MRRLSWALALVALAAPALAAPPLGDLNLPASRVPDWYAFDESTYQAARSWTTVDATCANAPCASGKAPFTSLSPIASCGAVTGSNVGPINCQIASAPARTVLYLPAGTYRVSSALEFARSDVVVRGAGRNATVLMRTSPGREATGGDCGSNTAGSLISICSPTFMGSSTAWTGGYAARARTVTLANASLFAAGDWILLRMSGDSACSLIDKPLNSGSAPDAFIHIAKVQSVSGAQVTLDRALRMDYAAAGCSGHVAMQYDPVENVGVEELRLTSDPAVPVCSDSSSCIKFAHVGVEGAANSWIVNVRVDRAWEKWSQVGRAARIWIQGNDFDDLDETITFNTEGIYVDEGGVDLVFENNTCKGTRVCQKIDNGAEGLITAYNFMRQDQSICERAYMNHGHYARENLFEGNDVDCEVMLADSFWGRNGPRITAYRNRNVSTRCRNSDSLTVNEDGNGGWFATEQLNVIGNTSGQFVASPVQNSPACPPSINGSADFSTLVKDVWLEKNAFRTPGGTFAAGTANNRSCGTGPNDACPGTNRNTAKPDASWSGSYPTSFYRSTAPPTWWCQEACAWSPRGIGAFGDDFTAGAVCKLPAQIRAEGGRCTPPSGTPAPPPPPPPPSSPPPAPTLL
jgi:hypothetical protein